MEWGRGNRRRRARWFAVVPAGVLGVLAGKTLGSAHEDEVPACSNVNISPHRMEMESGIGESPFNWFGQAEADHFTIAPSGCSGAPDGFWALKGQLRTKNYITYDKSGDVFCAGNTYDVNDNDQDGTVEIVDYFEACETTKNYKNTVTSGNMHSGNWYSWAVTSHHYIP